MRNAFITQLYKKLVARSGFVYWLLIILSFAHHSFTYQRFIILLPLTPRPCLGKKRIQYLSYIYGYYQSIRGICARTRSKEFLCFTFSWFGLPVFYVTYSIRESLISKYCMHCILQSLLLILIRGTLNEGINFGTTQIGQKMYCRIET